MGIPAAPPSPPTTAPSGCRGCWAHWPPALASPLAGEAPREAVRARLAAGGSSESLELPLRPAAGQPRGCAAAACCWLWKRRVAAGELRVE